MRRDEHIAWQQVDGNAILVDMRDGRSVGLNETGSFIWSQLNGATEPELIASMLHQFAVDDATATHDVRGFLGLLRTHGFLTD